MGKQALQCYRASRHRLPQRVQKKERKPKEKKDPSIMRRYFHYETLYSLAIPYAMNPS